jgi:hypothetical protein
MKFIKILLLLHAILVFSQSKEGYWDNIRSTNQTISLKTSGRKLIKSESLPTGTTEVVFRITVLDDNQQLSGSLVSILKSIPDPTGISQGSAGALFLVSKIAGDDKCKFAVFNSQTEAEAYQKSGKSAKALYHQDIPVNKQAKLLKGFTSHNTNLWFVFESDNWFMNQKIVVEVVPWVNYKESRGWNSENKTEVIDGLEKLKITNQLKKKEEFLALLLEEVIHKYTYSEYKQLLKIERDNYLKINTEKALKKTGEIEIYYDQIRNKANDLFQQNKITEAIEVVNSEMIATKKASYKDYEILSKYYLLTQQFAKAEEVSLQGLKIKPSEIGFQLNLAHVYLFTDRASEAKEIYKKFANQTMSSGQKWRQQAESDFNEFEKRNFPKQNYKKILRIIK